MNQRLIEAFKFNWIAVCPNCGDIAVGKEAVIKYFGIRDMNDGRKNPIRVQSWCRACRCKRN